MQVTKTVKSTTEVVLEISASEADLAPIKRHVLSHFAGRVKVPGFRAGKAPLNMIEKHVNQQAVLDEFMEHALNELYGRALEHEKVRPAADPKVELKKFVPYTDFSFTAEVSVIGPITVPDYKKIKLAKPAINVTAKDVSEVIDSLKSRVAQRLEVSRPAKKGDETLIDFEGRDTKDQPVAGAEGKQYPLLLGSNTFIPGFEEHLLGKKAGEVTEFTIAFPKDYGISALQGKKVTFKVTIHKVTELQEPKLDDKFAAEVGPFKSMAELKSDIKKQLATEKKEQAERQYQDDLVRSLVAKTKVDIPDVLIDEQLLRMEENEKRNLTYKGQTWQEHLDSEGLSEQQHRDRHRPEAIERIKGGLVLSEIASREDLKVTPDELEIRVQLLKGQYQDPTMRAELDKPENRRDVASRLLTEKTLERLTEFASKK